MANGQRVGVITNDQGRYLVDTAFFRLSELPAVEVSGGCFCCQYDDLEHRLDELLDVAHPDVIFAESVGTCADLVATVVKPLSRLKGGSFAPASFSLFTDSRLLYRRLSGDDLPFSEEVVYLFDQQIEEGGLLVVNKIDLLDTPTIDHLTKLVMAAYPGKPFLLQSSTSVEAVAPWVDHIQAGKVGLPQKSLDIDYERYTRGETRLAWLDQRLVLHVAPGAGRNVLIQVLKHLQGELSERKFGIGHIKVFLECKGAPVKISIPTLEETGWEETVPFLAEGDIPLIINMRAEIDSSNLRECLASAVVQAGVEVLWLEGEVFHPRPPHPVYRLP